MISSPLLVISDLEESFPGVHALKGAKLTVAKGEAHALLGENGAGKSTLLKILAGAQASDSGTILFDEEILQPTETPADRQLAGLVTIYQEFNLLPDMSVAENMFLGHEPMRRFLIDRPRMLRDAQAILVELGINVDARCLVRTLSIPEQQMVEIARAMTHRAKLIVMDEPTAALSSPEVEALHRLILRLKSHGVSVIYVTHRLEEVKACCDRFTIMRDGKFIAEGNVIDVEIGQIVRLMVGRDVLFNRSDRRTAGEIALSVQNISRAGRSTEPHVVALNDISLDIRAGEILGIAGLVGAGRTEFARVLFGADRADAGALLIDEWRGRFTSPAEALDAGVALVTEDRKQQGCFLDQSVRHNMTLPSLHRLRKQRWFIDAAAEERLVEHYARLLNIRMPNGDVPIGTLSGGNQQKVLLARYMCLEPRILIVDEPTRGIDIGAKSEVHKILADLATKGVAIIAISSDLSEVIALSDRIAVFREGTLAAVVDGEIAEDNMLMELMTTEITVPRDAA